MVIRSREQITTLLAAREQVISEWPGRSAADAVWLAYHQRAAELFARVAETDPGHRHEALFWAAQEREAARVVSEPGQSATVVVPEEAGDDA